MQRPTFRPHMSTGAWVFATGVAMAAIASVGVYAAVNSTVATGNPSDATTAYVTPTRQLQTTITAPINVVHVFSAIGSTCVPIYTPPSGKGLVITQVTYDLGTGIQGNEYFAALENADCGVTYDTADTYQAYETETRTYPSGMPVGSVGVHTNASTLTGAAIAVTGYLVPITQLPPEPPGPRGRIKGLPRTK